MVRRHRTAFLAGSALVTVLSINPVRAIDGLTRLLTGGAVSDPLADAAVGNLTGFHNQSSPSTAWCGDTAVVVFNDEGSLSATRGQSFIGYSRSGDRGVTFTDLGVLPTSLDSPGEQAVFRDPAVACTDASTFFIASLVDVLDPTRADIQSTAVFLSKSTDGGVTFGVPTKVIVAAERAATFRLNGFSFASDPTNPLNLYVAYSGTADVLFPGDPRGDDPFPSCSSLGATAHAVVEFLRSSDGGATWNAPTLVSHQCQTVFDPNLLFPAGTRIAIGDGGRVYLAWTLLRGGFCGFSRSNLIQLSRSIDGGTTFELPVVVASTIDVGMCGLGVLQDATQISQFPSLAVDRSRGPRHGAIYLSWHDGRFASVAAPPNLIGTYFTSDIVFVHSADGGISFSAPSRIGDNAAVMPADRYLPTLGVDRQGTVGVCYYDRSDDPANFLTDRRCARSDDGGLHWTGRRITRVPFAHTSLESTLPVAGGLGGFSNIFIVPSAENLTGDGLAESDGLLGAYTDMASGSKDVRSNRVPPEADANADDTAETLDATAREAGAVSDPTADAPHGRFGGVTQTNSSTAWCGDVVLVAYYDSGSSFETFGTSLLGLARSTNAGRTFTDLGAVRSSAPQATLGGPLGGPPAVACSDASTFYLGTVATGFDGSTTVQVSKSRDGGLTFGETQEIAIEDFGFQGFFENLSLAVDPIRPATLYLAFKEVDFNGGFGLCGVTDAGTFVPGEAIGVVKSSDGGSTWAPAVGVQPLADVCSPNGNDGPQLVVDGQGEVAVAWLHRTAGGTREIRFAKSTNGGQRFGLSVVITQLHSIGASDGLQGGVETLRFPSLAVDRSNGPRRGTLYIAWDDGTLNLPLPTTSSGTYTFSDILAAHSLNGGATWTPPVRVNDNVEPFARPTELAGHGTDQFTPAIAVDRDGVLGVCFYDRRRDSLNFLIDRRCARSVDAGIRWVNLDPVNRTPFPALARGVDSVGFAAAFTHDALVADFLGSHQGFVGGYTDTSPGNADVRAARFK